MSLSTVPGDCVHHIVPLSTILPIHSTPSVMSTSSPLHVRRVSGKRIPQEIVWKQGGSIVILTGSFDQWKGTIRMTKDTRTGMFRTTLMCDPGRQVTFKFIVDDIWRCSLDYDTEVDPQGNVNNVILTPQE